MCRVCLAFYWSCVICFINCALSIMWNVMIKISHINSILCSSLVYMWGTVILKFCLGLAILRENLGVVALNAHIQIGNGILHFQWEKIRGICLNFKVNILKKMQKNLHKMVRRLMGRSFIYYLFWILTIIIMAASH